MSKVKRGIEKAESRRNRERCEGREKMRIWAKAEKEKRAGGGFIERWRRGERRSEKIREREVELWRGSKELSHGGERETDETAGSVMEGGGEKTVTKFHGTNYR